MGYCNNGPSMRNAKTTVYCNAWLRKKMVNTKHNSAITKNLI